MFYLKKDIKLYPKFRLNKLLLFVGIESEVAADNLSLSGFPASEG